MSKKNVLFLHTAIILILINILLQPAFSGQGKHGAGKYKSEAERAKAEAKAKILKARMLATEGLASINKKDYKAAIEKLTAAAANNPLDQSVQYYLGLSALKDGDYKLAERALSQVVIMAPATSKWSENAKKCFDNCRNEFERVKPYSCLYESDKFWRWSSQKMPVKVYISPGLELPKGYSGGDLTKDKITTLAGWLRDPKFAKGLKPYRHYKEQYQGYVQNGLKEWTFADSYMKFQTVEDPTKANVLVFWCATLPSNAPGTTVFSEKKDEPVIVQFSVEYIDKLPLNLWPVLVQTIAAHEFGHAWGLQHSDFKRDIMYPTDKINFTERGTDQSGPNIVTPNDAATLRALYDLPAPVLK